MTDRERLGRLEGVRLVYFGDGNNVCASLMVGAAKLGLDFVAATPEGYDPPAEAVANAREAAAESGGSVELVRDPYEAVQGADALYTDVWTSMGQEDERERRLQRPGRLRDRRRARSRRPARTRSSSTAYRRTTARRSTESVLYGPQSAVWDEAENRLHAQKALMALVVRLIPIKDNVPTRELPGRDGRPDRGQRRLLRPLQHGGLTVPQGPVDELRLPPVRGERLVPGRRRGLAIDERSRSMFMHGDIASPGRQHALPLDLRQQRRGRARPRALPRLLPRWPASRRPRSRPS